MDPKYKSGDSVDVCIGPYKATRLWNDVVSTFRQGVPCGRHRRYMRAAENCFVGSSAVDWLLNHLRHNANFGPDVTRQQTVQLLNKFYKAGIFEEVQVSRRGRNKQDFSDSNRLYRLLPPSPSKSTRTALANHPSANVQSSSVPQDAQDSKKGEESCDNFKGIEKNRQKSKDPVREKLHRPEAPAKSPLESLPQCHLVGRILTLPEIGEIWKTAALSRLKKIIGQTDLDEVLQGYKVDGIHVRHNCVFVNKNGIVTNIPPEDQLPHWVMSAMKCLARWPEKVEGDLPSYPGFEKDVFGVVRDYFFGLPEPLIPFDLYDVITNVFVQVGNQVPRHSSPYACGSRDQSHLTHSLWSATSLENVILDLARKYCLKTDSMADTQTDQSYLVRGDSDWSHHSKSGLHRSSDCHLNLFSGGSSYDLHGMSGACSRLADPCRTDSQPNLCRMTESHPNLYRMTDSQPSLYRMSDSQPALYRMSDSQPSLYRMSDSQPSLYRMSDSQPSLFCMADSCRDLGMKMGHSSTRGLPASRHASLHPRHGGVSASALSFAGTSFPGGRLGATDFDGRKFRSTPDLQVTCYETAFGPENQTVTRVYYSHGISTDFHHGGAEKEPISPVETHFDVATEEAHSHLHCVHSCERCGNIGVNASVRCIENSRGAAGLGNMQTKPGLQEAGAPNIQSHNPSFPSWDFRQVKTRSAGQMHRRTRAERHNTFAGSQFVLPEEEGQPGISAASRLLSASTPYLPVIRENESKEVNLVTMRRKQPHCRRAPQPAAAKKGTSVFMRFPQSSLCEERVTKALQAVCLFLPPASRRRLHFLLKLMSKMATNSLLVLDPDQSTRSLVLGTFQRAVLRCAEEADLDEVLVLQLLSFMVDHHTDILAVPHDMKEAIEDRLKALEKPQIVYSPRDPGSLRFCQPTTVEQFETTKQEYSRQALFSLLDSIARDQNMPDRERKRHLKQFQKSHPDIYRQRFPPEENANAREHQPRIKPPLLSKPLLKLKGLRI